MAEDSRKLLVKLVGTERNLTQASLVAKFRGLLMTRVKTYLANLIREKSINIFSIDEHLSDMSDALQSLLIPDFADYGVHLAKFWLMNIVKPEEDRSYQKFKELHFRQYADVAEAQLRQQWASSATNPGTADDHRGAGHRPEARHGGLHLPGGARL